jgi:autophagy-related protein 9
MFMFIFIIHIHACWCAGRRSWTPYAYWRMREFGELPHFVEQRLHSAAKAARSYCSQFPAPITSAVAAFVAHVAAAAAALVIVVAVTHDWLMESHAWGHTLVWWLAAAGMVLTVARSMMEDEAPAYDPVRVAALFRFAGGPGL